MKKKKFVFPLLMGLLFLSYSHVPLIAQESSLEESFIAKYDFADVISGQGGRIDPTAPPTVENVVLSPFEAVSVDATLSEHSSTKAQFSFSGWSVNADLNFSEMTSQSALSAMDKRQYYEFSISPEAGFAVKVQNLEFKLGRTATGPRLFAVSSSFDNHASLLPVSYDGTSAIVTVLDQQVFLWDDESSSLANHHVNVDISSKDPLVFRFYGWAAEDAKGKFSIDNLEIAGSVYPIDPIQDDGDTSSPDTLQAIYPSDYEPYPCDTTIVSIGAENREFDYNILYPRPFVDAIVHLYNPSDSLPLAIEMPVIKVLGEEGQDLSDLFEVSYYFEENILPKTNSSICTRLFPQPSVYQLDEYSFKMNGSFIGNYGAGDNQVFPLYPLSFTLRPLAIPSLSFVFPVDSGMALMRASNLSSENTTQAFKILNTNASKVDSIKVPALDTGEVSDLHLFWPGMPKSIKFDSDNGYSPSMEFYTCKKEVDNHYLAELYGDSLNHQLKLFLKDGRIEPVVSSLEMNILSMENDTIVNVNCENESDSWVLMSLAPFEGLENLTLKSVVNPKGKTLNNDYYWQENGCWYVLDSLVNTDNNVYQLSFAQTFLESIIVNYYDSICLGDSYRGYGFDLPAQMESGDFHFIDSLKAVNGADSIVNLYLNVCDAPSMPEEIFGDSIIMQAGNYVYTIKPVPSAAFYVWTVLPESWAMQTQENTISLTIPYPGSGSISVRAVNRCGQSAERTMDITATDLEQVEIGVFKVLPSADGNSFQLLTQGIIGKTLIVVYDLAGNVVYQEQKDIQSEAESFDISMKDFAGGMYLISIVNEGNQSSAKIVKD